MAHESIARAARAFRGRAGMAGSKRGLADTLLAQFKNTEHGGFFFTSHDHEKLLHRPKPTSDDATPSDNGIAAFALQRLGHLLGERQYPHASERALTFVMGSIQQYPSDHPSLLTTLDEALAPPPIAILRGPAAVTPRALRFLLPNGSPTYRRHWQNRGPIQSTPGYAPALSPHQLSKRPKHWQHWPRTAGLFKISETFSSNALRR